MPRIRNEELTDRQREILRLIAAGKTNGEIAERLGISLDGAKYHVSEIIAKLGVASREDAAEWWRKRISWRSVARLLCAPLTASGWKLAGAATTLCVFGGLAVALLLLLSGGNEEPSKRGDAAATATADHSSIGFALCSLTTGWTKPSPASMTTVFATPRFTNPAGDGRPLPSLWAMYLSHFYWIPDYRANSARIEPASMSGSSARDPARTQQLGCKQQFSYLPKFEELWLLDHKALAMHRDGDIAVIDVAPDPQTYQVAAFPWPPDVQPTPITKTNSAFNGVRVLGPDGQLLFQEEYDVGSSIEYDDAGRFVAAVVFGSRTSSRVRMDSAQPLNIELFWNGQAVDANVAVLDDSGQVVSRTAVTSVPFWTPAAAVAIAPGAWTMRIDFGSGNNGGLTLLPAGSPRPELPK